MSLPMAEAGASLYTVLTNMYRYLVSVDPSVTCSGWALFGVDSNRLLSVGNIRGSTPKTPFAERLLLLHHRVEALFSEFKLNQDDVLVCESPTTMRDPKAAIKVEQVRGIFESAARGRGVSVPGRINPRSVHFEIMGLRGPQLARRIVKALAVETASRLYAEELMSFGINPESETLRRHQDIVDALLLGRLALTRVRSALSAKMPLVEIFMGETDRQRNARNWRPRVS